MEKSKNTKKKSWVLRCLDKIEVVGNRLPHPLTIFFCSMMSTSLAALA